MKITVSINVLNHHFFGQLSRSRPGIFGGKYTILTRFRWQLYNCFTNVLLTFGHIVVAQGVQR